MKPNLDVCYVEPSITTLGGGDLIHVFDNALVQTCREVSQAMDERPGSKLKAVVKLKVEITTDDDGKIMIVPTVGRSSPKIGMVFDAKRRGGVILTQLEDPAPPAAQLTLFDLKGDTIGILDRQTGEVLE